MLNQESGVQVRLAGKGDVEKIGQLIQPFVEDKILLPRSAEQIEKDLKMTWVVESNKQLIGCMNLTYFDPDLYEVRGLAVAKEAHGLKLGSRMLQASIDYLIALGKPLSIFALTYVPTFFIRAGFAVVEKEKFPAKIYEVCQYCEKRHDCREIAVEMKVGLK